MISEQSLTSIYGNADVLLNDNGNLKNDKKMLFIQNIYDDSFVVDQFSRKSIINNSYGRW